MKVKELLYDNFEFWFGDNYKTKDGTIYINLKSHYDLERIKLGVWFVKHEYQSLEESMINYKEYMNRQDMLQNKK